MAASSDAEGSGEAFPGECTGIRPTSRSHDRATVMSVNAEERLAGRRTLDGWKTRFLLDTAPAPLANTLSGACDGDAVSGGFDEIRHVRFSGSFRFVNVHSQKNRNTICK
jgi:hypothetical protein